MIRKLRTGVFEEPSVALQPLALTLTSTGGRLIVKWDESDFVLINFTTSDGRNNSECAL